MDLEEIEGKKGDKEDTNSGDYNIKVQKKGKKKQVYSM
jgi:hypothetical protein